MKGNKASIFFFALLLVIYITAELNAPKKFDWTPTLGNKDKNPFGSYIFYSQLRYLFPQAEILSEREPIYNVLHYSYDSGNAYILIGNSFDPGKTDIQELLSFVNSGNIVFLSAATFSEKFLDTLGLKADPFPNPFGGDSTTINFVNPSLKAKKNYGFRKSTIDGHFKEVKKKDSSQILGITDDSLPNFVSVQYGDGFFFVHAAPICFSNYFMLYKNNHEYIAKALSYIPINTSVIYWDEYYKWGREGPQTPLRFFLANSYLKWALYLTIGLLLVYVFFEMKRKQRVIPVIEPLRNNTLEYVKTVSSVYLSRHDNNSIASKKIQLWLEYIRNRYYLSTQDTGEFFIQQLQRKTGVSLELIESILYNIKRAEAQPQVTDDLLMKLSSDIDEFYRASKI